MNVWRLLSSLHHKLGIMYNSLIQFTVPLFPMLIILGIVYSCIFLRLVCVLKLNILMKWSS